ncbi:MAG: ABC transporter permease subunit, partial [Desulfovibrionaceae bacterium]|nr:ABC transporter permease subunit [Desulfovibrionaceae bacterium]
MAARKTRSLGWLYTLLVYVFMYLPILVVIVFSFNKGRFAIWTGFDLKWYELMLGNKEIINAAINSLLLAVSAATIATVFGSIMAMVLTRYRFAGRRILNGSVYLLTISPDIVMGISLLIIFMLLQIPLGFTTLLISHVVLCTPLVVITLMGRIQKLDEDLVDAARDLGASEIQA